jgi:hypothetical protein
MEHFGTYVYPVILLIMGAVIGGPLGIFGTRVYYKWRQQHAESIPLALHELITQYECASWIETEKTRVAKKMTSTRA